MIGSIAAAKSFALSPSAPSATAPEISHANSTMMQRKIGNPCYIRVFEYYNRAASTRNILQG
ncbi:hypothetical protein [Bradyrhizobium frederickii]|uniref:hypothetical protein n=1 Tax=Bradyrhizobium frederickii TaxID=2560054 RepID=UPI001F2E8DB0|nr:hypothetical protein [Bradyrhizobium frederickii]